jgi:hypothetical protein
MAPAASTKQPTAHNRRATGGRRGGWWDSLVFVSALPLASGGLLRHSLACRRPLRGCLASRRLPGGSLAGRGLLGRGLTRWCALCGGLLCSGLAGGRLLGRRLACWCALCSCLARGGLLGRRLARGCALRRCLLGRSLTCGCLACSRLLSRCSCHVSPLARNDGRTVLTSTVSPNDCAFQYHALQRIACRAAFMSRVLTPYRCSQRNYGENINNRNLFQLMH